MSDGPLDTTKAKLGARVFSLIGALYDTAFEYGLTKDDILAVIEELSALPEVRRPDGIPLTWGPMVAALAERIEEKTGRTGFAEAVARDIEEEER